MIYATILTENPTGCLGLLPYRLSSYRLTKHINVYWQVDSIGIYFRGCPSSSEIETILSDRNLINDIFMTKVSKQTDIFDFKNSDLTRFFYHGMSFFDRNTS